MKPAASTWPRCAARLAAAVVLCGVRVGAHAGDPSWIARGRHGAVATDSVHASRAGLEILEAGGNAVDAAVAVSFALAVTRPYSTGPGGGGFLIARFADGRIIVQDFRETAPAAATRDMFVRKDRTGPPPSEVGHRAVGVPGLVAGRCQLLAQSGTMELSRATAPAVKLARAGFPVDADYVKNAREVLEIYEAHPSLVGTCGYVYRTHLGSGAVPEAGWTLVQPKLADLIEGIGRHGPDFFYHGPVADAIAAEMRQHGGLITKEDLAAYEVRSRRPLVTTYRGYELVLMPPPSSGGVAIAQALNILETLPLRAMFRSDGALAVHYQIEATKHAMADRARWLGDADFVDVPVARLTAKDYARALTRRIRPDAAAAAETYGSASLPDDAGTSHFCVVDRFGNVVVSSETINTAFGSLAAVEEWGLILNNEMDDFVAQPGKPNAYGLIQSKNNAIEPGKRPLSSMSPTIVLKDGKPFILLGGSGGPQIITSVLNVLLGLTDYGLSLKDAMRRPRSHHQWSPDLVYFDKAPPDEIAQALARRGHTIAAKRRKGVVQAILRTSDEWVAASDPRKGGRPAAH